MERQGSKRVEAVGVNEKHLITAIFCGSLVGVFYQFNSSTRRKHPHYQFPFDWDITHSPKHWSNERTMLQYVTKVIIPYVEGIRGSFDPDTPALVIMDNFKGQVVGMVTDLLELNNIHVCLLPPNTTDKLQPRDISVNKPAKDFLKRSFEDWYSQKVSEQLTDRATSSRPTCS